MRYSYLAERMEGDPVVGRVYALPMEEGDPYQLDLAETGEGWTPWFVDVPATATPLDEADVHALAGAAGLPPDADAG